jgi:hypothetical protein
MSAPRLPAKFEAEAAAQIESRILLVRGQKVLLDFHLASLYGVETRILNQAVKRNVRRFPGDFMFQLTKAETRVALRSPGVTASNSSQTVMSSRKHRGLAYQPFAFTEQGVAMLSSVLRSPRAIEVNIEIMRAFVRLRQWLQANSELAARLAQLERRYDRKFRIVFEVIRQLMSESRPADYPEHREIGFHTLREALRGRQAVKHNGHYL